MHLLTRCRESFSVYIFLVECQNFMYAKVLYDTNCCATDQETPENFRCLIDTSPRLRQKICLVPPWKKGGTLKVKAPRQIKEPQIYPWKPPSKVDTLSRATVKFFMCRQRRKLAFMTRKKNLWWRHISPRFSTHVVQILCRCALRQCRSAVPSPLGPAVDPQPP